MSSIITMICIVVVVVLARLAYRMNMNFFTFIIGFGVLIFGGMVVTGTLP